jgi:threonine/homoserine/homoserine lactone efflux protein
MGQAIGQLLPLGLAVGLSPIPIVAVVLMLSTPRARGNGLAFLIGWIAGLAAAGAIVLVVSGSIDATDEEGPATWVSWLKIGLGVLLLLVGVKQWRGRPRGDRPAELPKWMRAIDAFKAPKALALGVALSALNPKNLLLTIAAAAAIAASDVAAGDEVIALAVFLVLGTLGVGAPVVMYFALGERSRRLLDELKTWMAANNAVIMAVLVLLIGAKLVGDGVSGL